MFGDSMQTCFSGRGPEATREAIRLLETRSVMRAWKAIRDDMIWNVESPDEEAASEALREVPEAKEARSEC